MLVNVTIYGDINMIKTEAEKILKYKDPITEIECMWNVKAKVIPMTGVTGTISKALRQYQSNILGKQEIKELPKKSCTGHCTHTMESANIKVQNIFHVRNNITCSTNYNYRTAATLRRLFGK